MSGTIEIYRGDNCENIIPLDQDDLTIGRERFNRICIPDMNVSRYHAKIYRERGQWYVEDDSANGTRLNDELLRRNRRRVLHHGALIIIGDYRLYYNELGIGADARLTHSVDHKGFTSDSLQEFTLKFLQVARDPIKIQGTYFTIGSDERNHVVLHGNGIDKLHASITVIGKTPYLQSYQNETSVNGASIDRLPVLLNHGDIVAIGLIKFIFNYENPDAEQFKYKIITQAPGMLRLIDRIEKTGKFSDVPVLLIGETGTGKELVAEAIHAVSPRATQNFVAVNCAALSMSIAESLLFGHVKGAFTSALQDHDGYFFRANGGTLFLDEIGELPPEIQSKLLRAIEYKEICRVGSSMAEHVDVRIIAATNRQLNVPEIRQEMLFREDLFYRLRGFLLHIPPLRERRSDIPLLMEHFLKISKVKYPTLANLRYTRIAFKSATVYDWPGNVRELFQVCLEAFLNTNERFIKELPIYSKKSPDEISQAIFSPIHRNIYNLLNSGMTYVEIAKKMKISRTTIYKWKRDIESMLDKEHQVPLENDDQESSMNEETEQNM